MRYHYIFVFFVVVIVGISCSATVVLQPEGVKIINPYENLNLKVRHRAMSHEHIIDQTGLEKAIGRGIDILCVSNYSPAIPAVPIMRFVGTYEDWSFCKNEKGDIIYETDKEGKIKYSGEYKRPLLKRIQKSYQGGFSNFINNKGEYVDLAKYPQLPNGEHPHFTWSDGVTYAGSCHVNFIGTFWGDAANGPLDRDDLMLYNTENNYDFTSASFRSVFHLWSLTEMIENVKSNLMFSGKVFGTINHPGYSKMEDWQIDEFMKYGDGVFKAMSIYNNSVSKEDAFYDISFYDHTLLRGIKLWCVAEDDWGRVHNKSNPEHRGCNLLYLDPIYETQSPINQSEMALDAYISGQFSAVGYGSIDLTDVAVEDGKITVIFNCVADRLVIDVDGNRSELLNVSSASVIAESNNRFIRFEAYKGDDFIFTQPFYIEQL